MPEVAINPAQEILDELGKGKGFKPEDLKIKANAPQANDDLTPEQIAENEKIAKEKEEADKKASTSQPAATVVAPKEEDLLSLYNTKFGSNFKSIAELNAATQKVQTKEEKEAVELNEKEEAFKYAVTKGLVKQEEIEAYAADKAKTKTDLYKQLYTDKLKANKAFIARITEENPDITKEELKAKVNEAADEQYNQYMFTDSEDEVRKQMRLEEAELFVDSYIQTKHNKFFGLDAQYKSNKESVQKRTVFNEKVNNAFTSLSDELEIPVELAKEDGTKETFNYKFKFAPEDIAAIKDNFLTDDIYGMLGGKELTDEQFKANITNALLVKNFNKAVQTVSLAHASAILENHIKDRKNIPVETAQGSNERGTLLVSKELGGPAGELMAKFQHKN